MPKTMAYCGHWLLSVAYFFAWISLFGSIVSLFCPVWFSYGDPPLKSYGLFLDCNEPYGQNWTCQFTTIGIDNEAWFSACQGLWTIGTGLLVITALSSLFVCCDGCRRTSCKSQVYAWTLLAAFCFIAADAVYGIFAYKDIGVWIQRDHIKYFDWGYYIAMCVSVLTFISAILFGSVYHYCIVVKEVD